MGIRTTVTLDEDVLERLKRESRVRGASFRDTLNELLRFALLSRRNQPPRREFRVRPLRMGLRSDLNYDDVEGLIAYAEGEDHR